MTTFATLTVADVMNRGRHVVAPATPVKQIAEQLADSGAAAVAVVSATGRVIGTVGPLELLRDQLPRRWRGTRRHTAGEVMSRVTTVDFRESLAHAVELLADPRRAQLFVTDDAGEVVGVLGRADALDPVRRPDKGIAAEAEQVVAAVAPPGDGAVRVDVHDGIVQLTGTMARRSDADRIAVAVTTLPGVVDVRDRVCCEEPTARGRR